MDIVTKYPVVILLASGLGLFGISVMAYRQFSYLCLVKQVIDGWNGRPEAVAIASKYLRTHAGTTRQSLNWQRFFLGCLCLATAVVGLMMIWSACGLVLHLWQQ